MRIDYASRDRRSVPRMIRPRIDRWLFVISMILAFGFVGAVPLNLFLEACE